MTNTYYTKKIENGSINISDEVLGNIVKKAASDVEGVAGLANTTGNEQPEFAGIKPITKGVKLLVNSDETNAEVIIIVNYGSNVTAVAEKVQSSVCNELESVAGIGKVKVNVHVAGIAF